MLQLEITTKKHLFLLFPCKLNQNNLLRNSLIFLPH